MIYILIGFVFLVIAFFKRFKDLDDTLYWLECLILILFAGLRNSVGGDTLTYMVKWKYLPAISRLFEVDFIFREYQPLWYLFSVFAKTIHEDFSVFQLLLACVVNISVFTTIKRYTRFKYTSVLVYYLLFYVYLNFEILRESLAIALFLFALPSLEARNFKKYYAFATAAFLFHLSAVILFILPIFLSFFSQREFKLQKIMKILFVVVLVSNPVVLRFIVLNFIPALEFKLDIYSQREWSVIGIIFNLIKCLTVYWMIGLRNIRSHKLNTVDHGLRIYFFFSILTLFVPIGHRFQNYFMIFLVIALSELLTSPKLYFVFKKSIIVLFYIVTTINYYLTDATNSSSLKSKTYDRYYPYYFVHETVPSSVINQRKAINYRSRNR